MWSFLLYNTRTEKKSRFDTEFFVPVTSLCGVVGSLSWFTKCLIGRTRNILSFVYINEKCIYSSENRACTIIECAIVCNVNHVTSTWPLIYLWSGATNAIHTPRTEIPSWNSLEVNYMQESVLIISIFHQPNSSTFQISSLSMTSSVVIFSIPQSFESCNKHPQLRGN